MKEMFWLWQENRYLIDSCKMMVFVSVWQSPNHPFYPCQRLIDKPLGGHAWEGNFSIHTRCALISQLYRNSALLLTHLPFFSLLFPEISHRVHLTETLPGWAELLAPGISSEGDLRCVIKNKCQQRARQDTQSGKNKIPYVQYVWGVKQNSVGS